MLFVGEEICRTTVHGTDERGAMGWLAVREEGHRVIATDGDMACARTLTRSPAKAELDSSMRARRVRAIVFIVISLVLRIHFN